MTFPALANLPPPPGDKTGWPWTIESPPLPTLAANGSPWPKISVVTPSYNQGAYLEETIRSVLLQGYPNLEYIIMDGGSSDESIEIIRKYEPWLTHWVSESDGGQASAINSGWRMATGDVVTWLNSDDTLTPSSLAAAVTTLFSQPDIGLVYGRVNRIDEASQVFGSFIHREYVPDDIVIRAINPIPQQGFLMKRWVLEKVGWLDESMYFCMDFDYWTRLALNDIHAKNVDVVLANFRTHKLSKTSTQYKIRIAERMRIYQKIFELSQPQEKYFSQRDKARAYAELAAGRIAFYQARDAKLTRIHTLRHIRTAKEGVSLEGVLLFLYSLVGDQGLQIADALRGRHKSVRRVEHGVGEHE